MARRRNSVPKPVRGLTVNTSRILAGLIGVMFLAFTSVGFAWSVIIGFAAYWPIYFGFGRMWKRLGKSGNARRKTTRKA